MHRNDGNLSLCTGAFWGVVPDIGLMVVSQYLVKLLTRESEAGA